MYMKYCASFKLSNYFDRMRGLVALLIVCTCLGKRHDGLPVACSSSFRCLWLLNGI